MRKYKIPVSVLVVIHTPDLQVLLLERADHPGFWQSVTGSQDGGETLRQTAAREVAEETGLDAEAFGLIDWNIRNKYEILGSDWPSLSVTRRQSQGTASSTMLNATKTSMWRN